MLMELPAGELSPAEESSVATPFTPELPDEEEQLYFIELRYRQYLATCALQELFESGELCECAITALLAR